MIISLVGNQNSGKTSIFNKITKIIPNKVRYILYNILNIFCVIINITTIKITDTIKV